MGNSRDVQTDTERERSPSSSDRTERMKKREGWELGGEVKVHDAGRWRGREGEREREIQDRVGDGRRMDGRKGEGSNIAASC